MAPSVEGQRSSPLPPEITHFWVNPALWARSAAGCLSRSGGDGREQAAFPAHGRRHSADTGSLHGSEAIIVKVLLKYGANYIFKQQLELFPSLLPFWKHTNQRVRRWMCVPGGHAREGGWHGFWKVRLGGREHLQLNVRRGPARGCAHGLLRVTRFLHLRVRRELLCNTGRGYASWTTSGERGLRWVSDQEEAPAPRPRRRVRVQLRCHMLPALEATPWGDQLSRP